MNVADVALAGTVTGVGTVSTEGALLASATALLLAVAFDSVTVQVVLALAPSVVVEHCRPEIVTGVDSVIVTGCDEPFRVAVMVAV